MVAPVSDGSQVSYTDLISQIQERFQDSGHRSLGALRVEANGDGLVVLGEVPTFYLKQVAQVLATQVCGELRLANQAVVTKPGSSQALALV